MRSNFSRKQFSLSNELILGLRTITVHGVIRVPSYKQTIASNDTLKLSNSERCLDFEDTLNEDICTVIVPSIRFALNNLSFGKTAFINTSERQSLASADRKGDGQMGRRSDMMFEWKVYELMFILYLTKRVGRHVKILARETI
ncbi:15476_t:CDS:2 [Funneliformis geosporum]|nr:15476_t:CDS:2 [Funneliformis geosporum]